VLVVHLPGFDSSGERHQPYLVPEEFSTNSMLLGFSIVDHDGDPPPSWMKLPESGLKGLTLQAATIFRPDALRRAALDLFEFALDGTIGCLKGTSPLTCVPSLLEMVHLSRDGPLVSLPY